MSSNVYSGISLLFELLVTNGDVGTYEADIPRLTTYKYTGKNHQLNLTDWLPYYKLLTGSPLVKDQTRSIVIRNEDII